VSLLRGVEKDDVERGQVLAKTGQHQAPHQVQGHWSTSSTRKRAAVTRRFSTVTVRSFYIRTTDVTGTLNLPEGVEM
jgi:elongation factor Tu